MTKPPGDSSQTERLQKALSRAGVASRRQAEKFILEGRVQVNGETVAKVGTRVGPDDEIRVDGALIDPEPEKLYLVLNKPPGYISTKSDPQGRPTVMDLIPERYHSVYPVGRLDWASEGLLFMTNDGAITNQMAHPRYGLERVYAVKLKGTIKLNDARLQRLTRGVTVAPGVKLRVRRVESAGRTKKHSWYHLTLTEGKNREIRRLCDAVGLTVLRLKRLSFGPLALTDLKVGDWRELTPHDVQVLKGVLRQRRKKK